jgi:hypothetical protein
MLNFAKNLLKKTPLFLLYKKIQSCRVHNGRTSLNVLKTFPIFEAHGIVIEDINILTEPLWLVVSALIEPRFKSAFIKTQAAHVFVAKREI